MEIGYVVKDDKQWTVDTGENVSEFDVGHYE
jgi:hypothetical protein